MEDIDDIKELVQKSAAGNSAVFEALYEHLVDKVFAYIRYRTHTEDVAIDLTQDVFVDIFKALPTFTYSSKEQFYGFVFTITKRKLATHYANKHTQRAAITSSFNEEEHHGELLDQSVASSDIDKALHTLDDTTREIVVLHHWSRYTFPEIASLIEMTESAVRVRHHRALKTLSALLNTQ